MRRLWIFVVAVTLMAMAATAPAFAEIKCDSGQGALCHCSGTPECKELEKSGACNSAIKCSGGQICDCVAKLNRANTNTLNLKKPLNKSQ